MMRCICYALTSVLVFVAVGRAAAQGLPTPVMRIGEWVEVGGETPVVVVLQAQEQLKAAGFDPGPVDGIFAPQTRTALRQYQQHHGLPATGVLDAATRNALGIR